ncbi:MAG: response regulator transcription factor [Myxococcota bacterium]
MRVLILSSNRERAEALGALLCEAGRASEVEILPAIEAGRLGTPLPMVVLDQLDLGPRALDLCRALRAARPEAPILMLTAEGLVEERVAGLEAGADDVLTVPYAASQMVARVGALERRSKLVPAKAEVVEADGCLIDLGRCRAFRAEHAVELSARESTLLGWLHRHRQRAVSREEILEHVFGVSPQIESRSVDVAISQLRKKIERDPARPRIVVSVKGKGYAWGSDLT